MASNAAQAEPKPNKNRCGCLTNFINNYLPENEQTYNFAIPIIGFSSSCVSYGMFMTFIYYYKKDFINYTMYNYAYMILSGACAVDLYYGLRNRNRKQYFFWIFIKIVEIILIIIAVTHNFIENVEPDFVTIGILLILLKFILLYYIWKRATSKKNRSVIPEENMYDIPSGQTYDNAGFHPGVSVY